MLDDVKENIHAFFDIEEFVVEHILKHRQLLNDMFIMCGYDELCFIRDSGATMGFVFGVIQLFIWIMSRPEDKFLHPSTYALAIFPGFGIIVGCLTNWLALQMIFRPINPIRLCGGAIVLQGLFLRRQAEVSAVYGAMVATDTLSAENMLEEMTNGRHSENLARLVDDHVKRAFDSQSAHLKPLVKLARSDELFQEIREDFCRELAASVPQHMRATQQYVDEALDMENTLRDRMAALPPVQFERMLHPVFEQDEWKLICMGGFLGLVVGMIQAYFLN